MRYALWIKANNKQEFTAMASTWLNGERWNDELKTPAQPSNVTNHVDIFNRAMEQADRMTANG
jgi:hypothetical protein